MHCHTLKPYARVGSCRLYLVANALAQSVLSLYAQCTSKGHKHSTHMTPPYKLLHGRGHSLALEVPHLMLGLCNPQLVAL